MPPASADPARWHHRAPVRGAPGRHAAAWGWHAARTLRAQWDEVRRVGEPTTPGETPVVHVPDARNAWLLHLQAAQAQVPGW